MREIKSSRIIEIIEEQLFDAELRMKDSVKYHNSFGSGYDQGIVKGKLEIMESILEEVGDEND